MAKDGGSKDSRLTRVPAPELAKVRNKEICSTQCSSYDEAVYDDEILHLVVKA